MLELELSSGSSPELIIFCLHALGLLLPTNRYIWVEKSLLKS